MKDYFLISEAAKAVHMTAETLRHYDRIGLAKPSHKDRLSNYRYYTKEDIVRLNTIRALQQMDLPLQKIKEVLEYDDLEKIIHFLTEAEKKADEKIAALQHSKARIQSAKAQYIHKLCGQPHTERAVIRNFPDRVHHAFRYAGNALSGYPLELSQPFLRQNRFLTKRTVSLRIWRESIRKMEFQGYSPYAFAMPTFLD